MCPFISIALSLFYPVFYHHCTDGFSSSHSSRIVRHSVWRTVADKALAWHVYRPRSFFAVHSDHRATPSCNLSDGGRYNVRIFSSDLAFGVTYHLHSTTRRSELWPSRLSFFLMRPACNINDIQEWASRNRTPISMIMPDRVQDVLTSRDNETYFRSVARMMSENQLVCQSTLSNDFHAFVAYIRTCLHC